MGRKEKIGHIGDMNQFEDYIKFEREKHEQFFLPYYKERGWEVIQDNIRLGNNLSWDVLLERDGKKIRIDEKARQKDYGDFLVEIVQDLKTGHQGWLFKEKDYYLYGSWDGEELSSLYLVDSIKLQEFIKVNWQELLSGMELSDKGWGLTLFAKIKWIDLLFTKIAQKLI